MVIEGAQGLAVQPDTTPTTSASNPDAALARVSVATVRPGETLLISTGRRLSDAELDEWSERLRPVMPDGVKFAIFDDDITVTVVRPDGP